MGGGDRSQPTPLNRKKADVGVPLPLPVLLPHLGHSPPADSYTYVKTQKATQIQSGHRVFSPFLSPHRSDPWGWLTKDRLLLIDEATEATARAPGPGLTGPDGQSRS